MGKKRSWKQYRAIDLTMFAGMLVIFEFIIVMAARFWFPGQPFTVSLVAAITTIVYMRWGCWGVIHAMLGGSCLQLHVRSGSSSISDLCSG